MLWNASMICELDPEANNDGDNRPWVHVMRTVVLGSNSRLGAMIRSVAINTRWCQKRLAEAGMVDANDNKCKLCEVSISDLHHRNAYPDGCSKLSNRRDNSLSMEAKSYAITHPKEMLIQYGWFMLRDLLECPDMSNYAGEERWHYPNELHYFSGTTFVDGSCIPCRSYPNLSRGGYGVVQIEDQLASSQVEFNENPDLLFPACGCLNVCNPHHKCFPFLRWSRLQRFVQNQEQAETVHAKDVPGPEGDPWWQMANHSQT